MKRAFLEELACDEAAALIRASPSPTAGPPAIPRSRPPKRAEALLDAIVHDLTNGLRAAFPDAFD